MGRVVFAARPEEQVARPISTGLRQSTGVSGLVISFSDFQALVPFFAVAVTEYISFAIARRVVTNRNFLYIRTSSCSRC